MTDYKEIIKKITLEKEQFLLEHPELQEFQNKIDLTLNEIGDNPTDRCIALSLLIMQNMKRMEEKLLDSKDVITLALKELG